MKDTGWQQQLQQLRTLRDEVKLEMHLGGMELQERWLMVEPRIHDLERRAHELGEEGRWLIEELAVHLRQLRKELRERQEERPDRFA